MNQQVNSAGGAQNRTSVERRGDRELVVTRTFDAPPSIVFKAWSQAELFQRWWVPKSVPGGVSLVACEMDVRTGGKYLEVVPNERIVWTNDEGEEGAITTVTFEDLGGTTLLSFHEIYPSKEALEEALQGGAAALPEQLDQLGEFLSGTGA